MKVWDLPTRIYHWAQAIIVAMLLGTGFNAAGPHELLGIVLVSLLIWRLCWGLFGSETSRFKSFVRSPSTVWQYIRGKEVNDKAGHNPAGGWMVIVLLALLLSQCFAGMAMAGFFDPILADDSILYDTELLEVVHLTGAYVLVSLILIHIAAISVYKLKGKPLVRAMVTGKQTPPASRIQVFFRSNIRAGIMLLGSTGVIVGILNL